MQTHMRSLRQDYDAFAFNPARINSAFPKEKSFAFSLEILKGISLGEYCQFGVD
jgi:hypothetical protein